MHKLREDAALCHDVLHGCSGENESGARRSGPRPRCRPSFPLSPSSVLPSLLWFMMLKAFLKSRLCLKLIVYSVVICAGDRRGHPADSTEWFELVAGGGVASVGGPRRVGGGEQQRARRGGRGAPDIPRRYTWPGARADGVSIHSPNQLSSNHQLT